MKKWDLLLTGLLVGPLAIVSLGITTWQLRHSSSEPSSIPSSETEEERRDCHRVIRQSLGSPFHDPHEAYIGLERVGNKQSVPLLILALKSHNPPKEGPFICTIGHCVDALRSLTGQDFGTDHQKWNEWWIQTGKALPSTNFHARATK